LIAREVRGNPRSDTAALRAATGGGVQIAFDIGGQAENANATQASLHSLRRRGGRVLMGSMATPLPVTYGHIVRNDWEIIK
jgi:alcohol dehydrogenase